MTDTTKRYRLLNPVPNITSRVDFVFDEETQMYKSVGIDMYGHHTYYEEKLILDSIGLWFEEVPPVGEPVKEREFIEVILPKNFMNIGITLDNKLVADTNDSSNWDELKFPLPAGKWSLHKTNGKIATLSSALNDTVVEDKFWEKVQYFCDKEMDKYAGKKYTQSEVDAIRKEAFCGGFFKGWYNGCFEEDKTYSKKIGEARYDAYLSSLNLKTKDTGSKEVTENDYLQRIKQLEKSGVHWMNKYYALLNERKQPTNDNTFVWDDNLVLEFARFTNTESNTFQGRYADLEQFKQSKQSAPPIEQEVKR